MASVKLYLDKRKKNVEKYPVKVLITHKGSNSMISTSLYATGEEWGNDKFTNRKPDYKRLNLSLDKIVNDIRMFVRSLEETGRLSLLSARDVKYAYEDSKKDVYSRKTFTSYMEEYKNRFDKKNTRIKYETTQARIKAFTNGKILLFEDITYEWLVKFDLFLSKNGTPALNGRRPIMSCIRSAFNSAKKEKIISKDIYPFDDFQVKTEKTIKRNISMEDLRKIKNLETTDEKVAMARDYFMLCFYLIGINSVDLYNLTSIEDGRIKYKREKTRRLYSIEVLEPAMKIINANKGEKKLLSWCEKYSSYGSFYNAMNEAIHDLRDKVSLPQLTQYWCRHTWATIAHKIGVSKDTIGAALGHEEEGDSVTWVYIEFDQGKIDEANRRVVDLVTKPEPQGKVISMRKVI